MSPRCRAAGSRPRRHAFDLEAAAVPFAGVSLGFSPGEFLDFLLGWTILDLGGDDPPKRRARRDYFADQAGRPR